jgi:hypothetical protein
VRARQRRRCTGAHPTRWVRCSGCSIVSIAGASSRWVHAWVRTWWAWAYDGGGACRAMRCMHAPPRMHADMRCVREAGEAPPSVKARSHSSHTTGWPAGTLWPDITELHAAPNGVPVHAHSRLARSRMAGSGRRARCGRARASPSATMRSSSRSSPSSRWAWPGQCPSMLRDAPCRTGPPCAPPPPSRHPLTPHARTRSTSLS